MTRMVAIGLTLLALAGCETAKGVGKDVGKAGDAISEAATDVQNKL